jgi:hypothetical protein
VVVYALTAALVRIDQHPLVRIALAVGILAATVLVLSSAWILLRPHLSASVLARTTVIIILSGALMLAGLTPVRILLLSAAAGAMLGRPLYARQERQ